TIWFIRAPIAGGAGTIMTSTRTSRAATWSTPTAVTELNGAIYSKLGAATSTTLVGYIESNSQIYRTTRATTSSAWSTPTQVTELAGGGFSQSPWSSVDDLAIIFSSDRAGTFGSGDLWLATRSTTAQPFGTPVNIM